MTERIAGHQLELGLFSSEIITFSKELLDRLRTTHPMDLLDPQERQELQDTLDESSRIRLESQNDARRMPLF